MKLLVWFLSSLFLPLSGAQEKSVSAYDIERRYLKTCQIKIDEKGLNISGEMSNCLMLGILYSKTGTKLRKQQKALGREIIKQACRKGERSACQVLSGDTLLDKGSDLIYWAAILFMGLATLLCANMMFQEEGEYQAQEKLEEGQGKGNLADYGIVLKYSRPFFRRYITPIVSSMKNKKSIREKYKRKLASAGLSEVLTPEDFFSFKIFLIVGFPIVFVGVRTFLEETWPMSLVLFFAVFGYFYPDMWISGTIKNRQKNIIRAMPFAVDMLALSVEAGLDFIAAMSKVREKAKPSPLMYEFDQLMKEIKVGASRAEALRNMVWRVDMIQISSFCATLIAADSVGASIGPILKSLAVEIREKKSSDVEKAGATAATKILFPMLFLIVPAVFIVVAAPMVLGFF